MDSGRRGLLPVRWVKGLLMERGPRYCCFGNLGWDPSKGQVNSGCYSVNHQNGWQTVFSGFRGASDDQVPEDGFFSAG